MAQTPPLPNSPNLSYVESLYQAYLSDPGSVSDRWRVYFESAESPRFAGSNGVGPSLRPDSIFNPASGASCGAPAVPHRQDRVDQLVRAYRVRGHIIARLDPLRRSHQHVVPGLKIRHYGFTVDDLDRPFSSRTIAGKTVRTLREIVLLLRTTYCRQIGAQFMHIDDLRVRHWLQDRMESTGNRIALARDQQLRILTRLTDAVIFEEFIQRKYLGAKRFSLEGGESLIPLLDLAIERAGEHGIDEIVLGMAHRGRVNVLANILGKSPRRIFREFADIDAQYNLGGGDVKYHLGHHCDWVCANGQTIHLALCFNPSHLEFVNPVALGRVRAKQDRLGDVQHANSMAILIHGDAAFAGQGIVQETLNLSELPDWHVGGTLHVVVNNQIGFTTLPDQSRSSMYCTGLAKMLQSPIFHVNGEDPEAVAQVIRLAMDFRHEFRRDVVVDMYCYRRYGHNEGDEPAFTQPRMYKAIKARKSVRDGYLDHLLALGEVTRAEADEIAKRRRAALEQELDGITGEGPSVPVRPSVLGKIWSQYAGGPDTAVPEVETGVSAATLANLGTRLTALPGHFTPHPKLTRILKARRDMAQGQLPVDWATGELLALASLAAEGTRVRFTGQDAERGTFSQRHAVWHDFKTGRPHHVLQHIGAEQGPVDIHNSALSEAGVLGFEYGYSIAYPDGLVVWEAQFGDFANAAQVIIDQFIASAEDKWHSLSGLVMLLPHGFEGQGPEHSSARLERFLTMAADDNIQVVYPTTPANHFHCLRRQVLRKWRKPLIVMTPKSLLRDPRATSPIEDFTHGTFRRYIPDDLDSKRDIRRVIMCSGKVFYDLHTEREQRGRRDVALIRLEQLTPMRREAWQEVLAPYGSDISVYWVQEEPQNMGAWRHVRGEYGDVFPDRRPLVGVARAASASPATGSAGSHKLEQQRLLEEAFAE